jgi:hypothetical protein
LAVALAPEHEIDVPAERLQRRPRSLGIHPLGTRELKEKRRIDADPDLMLALAARPRTRRDCKDGPRPCPWAGCAMHLALYVTPWGGPKVMFPDAEGGIDFDAMPETCALDIAERGPATVELIATSLGFTDERVRQLQRAVERKLRPVLESLRADDPRIRTLFAEGRPKPVVRPRER